MESKPEAGILKEAMKIVYGDRQEDYGHPAINHARTAAYWSTFLSAELGIEVVLTPEQVCMMNLLQKVSRHSNKRKKDNLVDMAGWAENAYLCQMPSDTFPF